MEPINETNEAPMADVAGETPPAEEMTRVAVFIGSAVPTLMALGHEARNRAINSLAELCLDRQQTPLQEMLDRIMPMAEGFLMEYAKGLIPTTQDLRRDLRPAEPQPRIVGIDGAVGVPAALSIVAQDLFRAYRSGDKGAIRGALANADRIVTDLQAELEPS